MLSLFLDDLANLAHEERLRNSLRRSALLRAVDGGPGLRRIRLAPRALLGAGVMKVGAWIGGIELEWGAELPRPDSRPVVVN